ncbi:MULTISPECIES: hypothetical protein [Thermococcaceae]|uniref:Uncharacterized protein n=2 Tax=Thermococcaceae TaxID=2259 RepID=A0A170SR47_9EURY|nr:MULTISPECIES: hypothetical protein [Thermococcaceae]AMM54693.1 hypothetical protein TQ32_09495 [Pyrococcus kukulkanii]ASJ16998.1 hypothetical protein A3L04_07890 [Thermococcus chitonophagus]RLF88794.1 MAG: hypothetical protein DRN82_05630 [Thermococci archaeon]CUX78484.1 hypothetical protein CHITON_1705 [Thermococcus chitonophagus]
MTEIRYYKIGEDRFKISEDEVARRELRVAKVSDDVIQIQEEVHGIIALVGATSSVNIKKEEFKELVKLVREEFGWDV